MENPHTKAVLEVAFRYAGIDGAHHKQWVIDQMLRALLREEYAAWIRSYNEYRDANGETYPPWDEGIAP